MRRRLLVGAAVIGMFFFGLTLNQKSTLQAKQSVTSKDVSRKAKEAMVATKEYSIQKKKEFQAAVKEQLDHMQSQIRALQLKVRKSSDNVKREFNQSFRTLEKQKKQTYQLLDDLDRASSQTWKKVKSSLSEAMNQLKQSYDEAVSSITE